MPKPELVPLTGGYRRIPVLQIGADVYCDSQLIARVLERLHPDPTIYPRGSEGVCDMMNLWEVSQELSRRLSRLFLRDKDGKRPIYGGESLFHEDPHFRDYLLFHEYFHGDNGAGLGAGHQTGWTALVAKLLEQAGE